MEGTALAEKICPDGQNNKAFLGITYPKFSRLSLDQIGKHAELCSIDNLYALLKRMREEERSRVGKDPERTRTAVQQGIGRLIAIIRDKGFCLGKTRSWWTKARDGPQ